MVWYQLCIATTLIIRIRFSPKHYHFSLLLRHFWSELQPITWRKNVLSDMTDCSRVGRAERNQPEKNSARQNECQWLCSALFMAGLVKCQKLYPRESILTPDWYWICKHLTFPLSVCFTTDVSHPNFWASQYIYPLLFI